MDGDESMLFGDLHGDDRGGHQAVRSWLHAWRWETREARAVGNENHVVGGDEKGRIGRRGRGGDGEDARRVRWGVRDFERWG